MPSVRFPIGAVTLVSGPKPHQAVPIMANSLPVTTASKRPATTKGSRKKAKVAESLPEPNFSLDGYEVLPAPTTVTIESMKDTLVAHRFSVEDWSPGSNALPPLSMHAYTHSKPFLTSVCSMPGWDVGTVVGVCTAKRTAGQFLVDYPGYGRLSVYRHVLSGADHGVTKTWVGVKRV